MEPFQKIVMKNLMIVFQILIFVWMQIAPVHLLAQEATEAAIQREIPPMPRNYKFPDMHLLDTVAFYQRFKDQVGKRIDVEGVIGRYGATFGKDFKQKIYEIEQQYNEKIEIILTLSSTREDAEILKQNMETKGKKMVIVEIPDWLQQRFLERAARESQGHLAKMSWEVQMLFKAIVHPQVISEKASDAIKILKNQYVTPTKRDIKIAAISATTAGVLTGIGFAVGVGIDPMMMAAIMTGKVLFVGGTSAFSRTIANAIKADYGNEFKVMTGFKKFAVETYYSMTMKGASSFGSYDISQLAPDSLHTVLHKTVDNVKEKKLSEEARDNLVWYNLAFGTAMGLVGTLGLGHHIVLEYGFIHITQFEITSFVITSAMLVAYLYRANHFEKLANNNVKEMILNVTKKITPSKSKMREPYLASVTLTMDGDGPSCSRLFQ
jgi:hypothetical protein